jgi:hypothetical protein
MTSTFPLYAAALGIDLPGIIQRETNKAKYRAADRQASYREKEQQRREEYNRTHFGG